LSNLYQPKLNPQNKNQTSGKKEKIEKQFSFQNKTMKNTNGNKYTKDLTLK
jgi:hypothetical protein